jgi:integrase
MGKLTQRLAETLGPGFYADGDGLYLQVGTGPKARSWISRYYRDSKPRDMGLGPLRDIPLKLARELHAEARRAKAQGIDPIARRQELRQAERVKKAKSITFQEAWTRYIAMHEQGWKNRKHGQQWTNTLTAYARPINGMPVHEIGTPEVLQCLEPIWSTKVETASRLRGRIEKVLAWAIAGDLRLGPNPAAWKGLLEFRLPRPGKVHRTVHHAALPFAEIPAFMADLRGRSSVSARALEVLVLTAARTTEILGAQWSEFDLGGANPVWKVPSSRMKAGREHRVPLSRRAVEILRDLFSERQGELVFTRNGSPLSNMSLAKVLVVMNRSNVTVHGMRSSFRTWIGERTSYPREVAEAALAHVVGDATERAYARGDVLDPRRKLMEAWGAYCNTPPKPDNVVSISDKAAIS